MPLSRYFNKPGNSKPGKGEAIMAAMKRRYGAQRGERIFYGTVNNMRKGSSAERAAQPGAAPGQALAAASKRRRARTRQLGAAPQANGQQVNGASLSTTRIGY